MVAGVSPAVARRRVRLAIRAARDKKNLTQGQVAEAMEWSLSKVMRIESGEVTISATDLRRLLPYIGISGRDRVEELVANAKVSRQRKMWWAQPPYRDVLPAALTTLIQYEQDAREIRHFNLTLVPGLFQTRDYAEAVLRCHSGELTENDIRIRLDARVRRQQEIFHRREALKYLILLDESVLHREVGGAETMARQLQELLGYVRRGQVLARIVPFAKAASVAVLGPFTIVDVGEENGALLYRESHSIDEETDDAARVARHRRIFEQLWDLALDDSSSSELIEQRAKEMLAPVRRKGRRHPDL